jgi:hypothetical protein
MCYNNVRLWTMKYGFCLYDLIKYMGELFVMGFVTTFEE